MSTHIEELLDIMKKLRRACPWDREQTPQSLRRYIIEEAYEVISTIDEQTWDQLAGELGDLLLQIVFQSAIAEENHRFTFTDVVKKINEKLIVRHPHVFGDKMANSAEQVADNWEHIKYQNENRKSILSGIPEQIPALLRAQRLQEKAAKVGFDWNNVKDVINKIDEELDELKVAVERNEQHAIAEEMGDFLFSTVNLCRFLKIVAEDALRLTNKKFIDRFFLIENHYKGDYQKMKDAPLADMDKIWEDSKNKKK